MVGPYETLCRGRAPSQKSLALDYDKTPPHFQLFQSLKAKNIALVTLTIAIFLVNVLVVTFAGLFSTRDIKFETPTESSRLVAPPIRNENLSLNFQSTEKCIIFY